MKLGLLTAPFPETPLTEVADWAGANGFRTLEVACWPRTGGKQRRYAGTSHIDVVKLSPSQATELTQDIARRGVDISALGYYPNPLHPDPQHRAEVQGHLRAVISAAALMGVPVVNTFVGNDKDRTPSENFTAFRHEWPALVSHAEEHGVRIAIENCPMIFSEDEWPGGNNLAHSPAVWRDMFEAIPSDTLGLNFDPSHLVWQMIDCERAIEEFGSRIYYVQAKDVEIDRNGLYQHGTSAAGIGWQRPRLPGLGEVNWQRFFSALYRAGYQGAVTVEHEDRQFEATDDLVKAGFLLARNTLAPYLP
ncbi:MAG: sugar phosphate isomerase/epimerase [Actinomycetota bacterium]|nr:sugar phosphate isomerase/epimerase [Actinomycetota bacterium]